MHLTKLSTISYANMVVNNPWKFILLNIFILIIISSGASKLQFDTNYRVFFADKNPQLEAFDSLERIYSKTDNVLFTIKPKSGDVFQKDVIELIQELTDESWKLPYAQRVDSLSNFQHSYAIEDELIVSDLIEKTPDNYNAEELNILKNIALNEPLLVGKVISSNAQATGINVTLNLTGEDAYEAPKVTAAVRKLLNEMRSKYPNIEMKPSGIALMNNAFMESSMQDMQKLVPIMYLILLITMVFFLRSITATLATTLVIIFSAMTAMGFGGWMGFPLTPPSASTPTIVLTLAIADSIHIIMSMLKSMQTGMKKREAIIESLRINMQPIFLTSLTTIIGFLSLNFSKSPPFWHLGNMTAFGILAAFIYSVMLLPALLTLLPVKVKSRIKDKKYFLNHFADLVIKKYKIILVISITTLIFLGSMIQKIELNDEFLKYFDYSIDFRPDSEFMIDNLTGIYAAEYSVKAQGPSSISEPEYLHALENFSQWLRTQPEVLHVFSMADIFKRLNKNMHGDDSNWYKIPDDKNLAAQYLLLYEISLPYGLDLNDRVNIQKSATRVSVTLDNLSTNQIKHFKNKSENWLKNNTPDYMQTESTSPVIMFSFISQRNIDGMIKGNLISLILISLCIMIALRNIKIGIFSLIPNLTPIILGFGIWGVFIGQINMAVAIASSVSLGIIVDDTVHFLSKYLRARREKNLNCEDAIRYAFSTVGSALIATTVILMFGFLILAQSAFQLNSYLGMLTALILACALIADFLLLPTLLIIIDQTKNIKGKKHAK